MEMSPKAILTTSMRRTTFMLNIFWSEIILRIKSLVQNRLLFALPRAKQAILALPIRHGVLWAAPFSASWQSCIPMALTFTYELRLERFLYQNPLFQRDEDNPCRSFFHTSRSSGCNEPNSVLNTKSQYFKHNFGLRDEIGWWWPKLQRCSYR